MSRDLPCKPEFHHWTLIKGGSRALTVQSCLLTSAHTLWQVHARRQYIHNYIFKLKKNHSRGRIPREAAGHGVAAHVHGGSEAGALGRPGHARFAAHFSWGSAEAHHLSGARHRRTTGRVTVAISRRERNRKLRLDVTPSRRAPGGRSRRILAYPDRPRTLAGGKPSSYSHAS